MEQALTAVGAGLRCLPDGETGDRFHWIIHIVESMRSHPDLEVRKEGRWTGYDDVLVFKERKGHKLTGDALDFGHVKEFERSFPLFLEARERANAPRLAFQVGVPGDLDMALFVLGPQGAALRKRPFTDATVAEIEAIHAIGGDDVIFQVEIPVELVAVARMPKPIQPVMAAYLARGVANLARRSPAGARFGVHLCLGDMNHEALGRMKDTGPVVALANALARAWPDDRPLEFVHAPFAAAEEPRPTDPAWYAPLRRLKLQPGTRLAAGMAHEDQPLEQQLAVLGLIEAAVGGPVAVSHSCGLGRRTPDAAGRALARAAELSSGAVPG
jgi:hypothetical protein